MKKPPSTSSHVISANQYTATSLMDLFRLAAIVKAEPEKYLAIVESAVIKVVPFLSAGTRQLSCLIKSACLFQCWTNSVPTKKWAPIAKTQSVEKTKFLILSVRKKKSITPTVKREMPGNMAR